MPLISFSPGQVISSANANANWGLCVLTDTSRTVTVTHTYTATQTFTGGWTAAAACTISSGGISITGTHTQIGDFLFTDATYDIGKSGATRPRDLFLSRNLTVGGEGDFTGALVVSNAATPTVSQQVTVASGSTTAAVYHQFANTGGTVLLGAEGSAAAGLFSGTAAYSLAIGTVGARSLHLATNGAVQFTIDSTGVLSLAKAASQIVPGATSFSHRNNLDSADNLLILDDGTTTVRGVLTITASGGLKVGANQVVIGRATGWTAMTGTPDVASTFATGTVTLIQLAERVKSIQDALSVHGLIGV